MNYEQFEGHTEGPWETGPVSWDENGDVRYTLVGNKDASWADARLIEAAPDLLAENKRLREALEECRIEIDNYTDAEKPVGVHPKWDAENARLKALNPARTALQEVDDEK